MGLWGKLARAGLLVAALGSLQGPLPGQLPPAVDRRIDFVRDVQPILAEHCMVCHSGSAPRASLSLHRLEDIIQGGVSGPALIPGLSDESLLIRRVSGLGGERMPMAGPPLSAEQIGILRAWIDQGAKWDPSIQQLQTSSRLAPRKPEVPSETALSSDNPVDRFVGEYLTRNGIKPAPIVSDDVFLRRVYFDLWGLAPSPAERKVFLTDQSPGKRARLIDQLLSNERRYSEHWISLWNDWLRNDEGVIYHGERKSITPWLLGALERNTPYDEMVRALLNPRKEGDPDGFLTGVTWRGTINASQTPPMQAAQNSAQLFLGINIKCASCHDSFINQWKLRDSYGLASFFSDEPLELVRCDVPQGEMAEIRFLYPELGHVPADATLEQRRTAAARLFTSAENGRFARTLVNRYWKLLLGRGLVEPVDDMDQPAWNADLLDWLAVDFSENSYDLKQLLRRLMTSKAYQFPAVAQEAGKAEYLFRGPFYRRLTAEQFVDTISEITGEWRVQQARPIDLAEPVREWRLKATPASRVLGRPVRDQVVTVRNEEPTMLQALELVNGSTLASMLLNGAERMLGRRAEAPRNLYDSGIAGRSAIEIEVDVRGRNELWLVVEDADSYDAGRVLAGWADASLTGPGGSEPLSRLIEAAGSPLQAIEFGGKRDEQAVAGGIPAIYHVDFQGKAFEKLLATIAVDDSTTASDINPRVRFFVFDRRPDPKRRINVSDEMPVETPQWAAATDDLIAQLYQHALSREPGAEERAVAREFVTNGQAGGAPSTEGLEDLLWSVFLSPEFQYIR